MSSSPVCMVVNGPGKVEVRLDYIKCEVPPPLGQAQANPPCFRVYWLFIIAKEFKYISTVLDQKLVCAYENVAPGSLGSIYVGYQLRIKNWGLKPGHGFVIIVNPTISYGCIFW